MIARLQILSLLVFGGFVVAWPRCLLAEERRATWDGTEPPQGVYFHWYEPSFYAGFAPRVQDPRRVHVRLSRGNQVRVTAVLGEEELTNYLIDLAARKDLYREVIEKKVIELTTNLKYERFVEKLNELQVEALVKRRNELSDAEFRAKSFEILAALNPHRIFKIQISLAVLCGSWHKTLQTLDLSSAVNKLDAANALLPGRLNLFELSADLEQALLTAKQLSEQHHSKSGEFLKACANFLDAASSGRYTDADGTVKAVEFSAIYPAGTHEGWVDYKGVRLPNFGVTGVWRLIPRNHGKGVLGMVDYLSNNPGYGYISMLPYQYAGGIAYNAFHNTGVRCGLSETPFLPKEWRVVSGERNPGKNYQNLWIISRGPTSHGCTRIASGHMSELRQLLPSASKTLEKVLTFRNQPQCYDLFDIEGDGHPEVMGVKYFLAYRSKGHTPWQAYASNKRKPFYAWLYGDNVYYDEKEQAILKNVPVCRFVGNKAEESQVLEKLPIYEAVFEPEAIQFYVVKPVNFTSDRGFEFNRELRKAGAGHQLDRKKLFLE